MQTSAAVHDRVEAERDQRAADDTARRFARASAIGAAPALAVFVWFVNLGRANLFQRPPFGDFYDVQARSLLHGHLSVPAKTLAFEGILIHGKTYEYYGPFPALLRMPVMIFTSRFDGRLTQVSMILAFAVALLGAARLLWRARTIVRPGARLGLVEAVFVGTWTFVLGVGSAALFPASRAIVYHEAEIWGAALALVGLDAVIGAALQPTRSRLAAASAIGAAALLTRASVGLGPAVALGVLALAAGWRALRRDRSAWRTTAAYALAALVPIVAYAIVNRAKFGTWFSVPLDKQGFSHFNRNREAALRANGCSLFNLKYLPTTLWQYARPDAMRIWRLFPFLDFSARPAPTFLGVRFDTIDRSASVLSSMPALAALAFGGVVAFVRRRLDRPATLAFAACTVGAAVAVVPTLTIGFIANRYLIDFLPLLVVPAVVTVQFGLQRLPRERRRHPRRLIVVVALVALVLGFEVWANTSLTLTYQRLWAAPSPSVLRGFVGWQESVADRLGTPRYEVLGTSALPAPPPVDTLALVGNCDGLYWGDPRFTWVALEVGPAGTHVRLSVRFEPGNTTRGPVALVVIPARRAYAVRVASAGDGRVAFDARDASGHVSNGQRVRVPTGRAVVVDAVIDHALATVVVTVDGREVLNDRQQFIPPGTARPVAPAPGVPTVVASVRSLPVRTPMCDRVRRG